jgi:hypothetical protein
LAGCQSSGLLLTYIIMVIWPLFCSVVRYLNLAA